MNYLSHFYFDQHNTSAAYLTGIALPDLCKVISKNIHIQADALKVPDGNATIVALNEGWKRHVWIDGLFHDSDLFKYWMSSLNTKLRTIPFPNYVKPFILGHIGIELLLDYYLLEQKRVSTDLFYQNLEQTNVYDIQSFMLAHGIHLSIEQIKTPYERFLTSRYLASYTTFENLAYALSRIMQRIWGEVPEPLITNNINTKLEITYQQLSPEFVNIFDYIQHKINAT